MGILIVEIFSELYNFDREFIDPYENHKMEKEIFKYKDIIENAIVIFLENSECWNNYIGRETNKGNKGHKTSYEILSEEKYMDMVKMFGKHQLIYNGMKRYKKVRIENDNKSWKRVYQGIKTFLK